MVIAGVTEIFLSVEIVSAMVLYLLLVYATTMDSYSPQTRKQLNGSRCSDENFIFFNFL